MQTIAAGPAIAPPNNSTARTAQAIGVLEAAPNTAAKQAAAAIVGGSPSGADRTEPNVAPTTNSGVT